MSDQRTLQFGIYPLSAAGSPEGLAIGPPDDYEQIRVALEDLGDQVVPRTYLVDIEPGGEQAVLTLAERYRAAGLLGDVTMGCLRDSGFELNRWLALVRTVVRRYGAELRSLQITNEPNLTFMDGAKPYVLDALVHGVLAAKSEALRLGLDLDVGFGSVPQQRRHDSILLERPRQVRRPSTGRRDRFRRPQLLRRRVPAARSISPTLRYSSKAPSGSCVSVTSTAQASQPSVPIRVTENGWPTGTNPFTGTPRTYERQAEVIDIVVQTVRQLADELNITHYILFGLRDADSSKARPLPPVRHHARRLHAEARVHGVQAPRRRTRYLTAMRTRFVGLLDALRRRS